MRSTLRTAIVVVVGELEASTLSCCCSFETNSCHCSPISRLIGGAALSPAKSVLSVSQTSKQETAGMIVSSSSRFLLLLLMAAASLAFVPQTAPSFRTSTTSLYHNKKKKRSSSTGGGFGSAPSKGSSAFRYAGAVLPGRQSPQRVVADEAIVKPDYHRTGTPASRGKALLPWMVEVKSAPEIRRMRDAGRLGRHILDLGGRMVEAGVSTDEIDAAVHDEILKVRGKRLGFQWW